jgi:hypothetical protein
VSPEFRGVGKATSKTIVIGETSERVAKEAKRIGAKYYVPRKSIQEIGLKKALRNNYQWFYRKVKEGYKVIDIGVDPARKGARGLFYQAEQRWKNLWGI